MAKRRKECDEGCNCQRHESTTGKRTPLGAKTIDSDGRGRTLTGYGWEYTARVVLGLRPGDPREVHHQDGNPLNDDPSNLKVYSSREAHILAEHSAAPPRVTKLMGLEQV